MKKLLLTLFLLLGSIGIHAVDFKVGDAKYEILQDGTVAVKEYKKASGEIAIPESVTDPKTKQTYKVTSIGKGAFKKAPMTSVTIPASVSSLGSEAFEECSNLSSVKFLGNISKIPYRCFYKCTSLEVVSLEPKALESVSESAFAYCKFGKIAPICVSVEGNDYTNTWGVVSADHHAESTPIIIYPNANIDVVKSVIKNISPNKNNLVFVFTDEHPGAQAINVFSLVTNRIYMDYVEGYINPKRRFDTLRRYNSRSLRECLNSVVKYSKMNGDAGFNHPDFVAYFGTTIDNDGKLHVSGSRFNAVESIEKSADDVELNQFKAKMWQFYSTAIGNPANLRYAYQQITPEEAVKYRDEFDKIIQKLCDDVYLGKPELSDDEVSNLSGFVNNTFMKIGADYGIANCDLEKWARKDMLNKDIESGHHKTQYERVLMLIDRYFAHKEPKADPYHQAMQLAALCGQGKWAEAAKYYPKVHQAVTDRGKYMVPYELEYMRTVINEHGQKVAKPVYNVGKKKASGNSSTNSSSLIEFFTDRAIKGAVNHYQKKKEEKREQKRQEELLMKMNNRASKKR